VAYIASNAAMHLQCTSCSSLGVDPIFIIVLIIGTMMNIAGSIIDWLYITGTTQPICTPYLWETRGKDVANQSAVFVSARPFIV